MGYDWFISIISIINYIWLYVIIFTVLIYFLDDKLPEYSILNIIDCRIYNITTLWYVYDSFQWMNCGAHDTPAIRDITDTSRRWIHPHMRKHIYSYLFTNLNSGHVWDDSLYKPIITVMLSQCIQVFLDYTCGFLVFQMCQGSHRTWTTSSWEFLSANLGECGGRWAREVLFLGHQGAKSMGRWENLVPGSRRWPTEFGIPISIKDGPWLPVRKLPEGTPWYQFTKGIQFTRWLIMIDHHRPFHWSSIARHWKTTSRPTWCTTLPPHLQLMRSSTGTGCQMWGFHGPWHLGLFQWAITILGGSSHLVSGS